MNSNSHKNFSELEITYYEEEGGQTDFLSSIIFCLYDINSIIMNAYFLPILAGILVALGQFLLKKALGSISVEVLNFRLLTLFIIRAATNAMVISAILLMISGTITYFVSLRFMVLSRAVPITASVVLTCSILLGWLFLNEDLSFYQVIGLSLITCGVAVLVLLCK